MKKKIGIDARMYGPSCKGLGRYIEELVKGVTSKDKENEYVIFLSAENFGTFQTDQAHVKKVLADIPWYGVKEQLIMPYLILKEGIDLMHFPHFNVPVLCPAAFVVTVHDLILSGHSSQRASTLSRFFYKFKYLMYKIVIHVALWRSKRVITVSEYTKNDIVKKYNIDRNKIDVTYEAVSPNLVVRSDLKPEEVIGKYGIEKKFIMYVGNAYPHKNLENLVEEFSKLDKNRFDFQLVLVGGEDYFYKRLKELVHERELKNIVFTGFVPDKELAVLYEAAEAYVFPSLFEGFGLPPLEAMAHGCPVFSSNKTCLPEVLGEAAMYFDPETESWLEGVLPALYDEEKMETVISRGHDQVDRYSWSDLIEKSIAIYNKAK